MRLSGLTICLLLAILPINFAGAAVIVQDGQSRASIVLPAQASATEQFAAQELARYLTTISGAKLPIISEPAQARGLPIYVGKTSAASGHLPQQPEGLAIRVSDQSIVLCGGSARGTLYAVYRFLERCLGCRWLAPDQEYVPHETTIEVKPVTIETAPAFDMRTFVARRTSLREWGCKMGMNGFYTQEDVNQTGDGYYLPKEVPSCHSYARFIPADKYFAQHPEWFPLINGKRQPNTNGRGQLCVTAPGLADEFAKRVMALFKADPDLQVTSISPDDGRGWCQCPACLALDKRLNGGRTTKQGLAADQPFMGDRVFWFANQVAERVAKVYPDKKLLELAYINYAEPPDTIRPLPNVIPWLCDYAPADYSRRINDPSSQPNREFNNLLLRWAKIDPNLLFYSYVSKSMWWRLPRPVTYNFASDIKYLHSLGIHRYYCQSSLSDWALDGPLYYVIAKLLWNPSADPQAIAQEWIKDMFGPAAGPMSHFYEAVRESINPGKCYSDNPIRDVPGLYNMLKLDEAMKQLTLAKAAAKTPEVSDRIAQVTACFSYGYHMIRSLNANAAFTQDPTRQHMHEALSEAQIALTYYRVREAERYLGSIQMNDKMGVVAVGFSKALQLGGRTCWNSDETGPGDHKAGWGTLVIQVPDPSKPVRLEMEVWGKSDLAAIVVNTGGKNRGYSAGGVWLPVKPEKPLSGKAQWDTLVFDIPVKVMAPGQKVQRIGMGGGDSQIWIAQVRVQGGDQK